MKLKVVIHEAEEGGYWAEIPAIPGCMTRGSDLRISVPVHGNQNLKIGLQKAMMKLAGIRDNEL